MTATPKKSTEAEDVLEFLNSLPETSKKDGAKTDADILNFLDELEANDKSKDKTKGAAKVESKEKRTEEAQEEAQEEVQDKANADAPQESTGPEKTTKEEPQQDFIDPIASISNWWSSSGSATVTSLWSNAQQLTQKAQEEAQKLAKDTNIDGKLKQLQNLQLDEETKKKILNAREDIDPSKAIGFFTKNITSVLNSILATDEILKISVTHDLENYNVDSLVSQSFKTVMKQVQGGIDIEIKKSTVKDDHDKRNLNIFQGKSIDGEKLAFANIETIIKADSKDETKDEDQDDEIRSSNLYISIVAVQNSHKDQESETTVIDTADSNNFYFTIILKDTTNDITIITRSQAFPIKWAKWLDGSVEKQDQEAEQEEQEEGVDPAEWVKTWVYDGIGLSLGVLAQSYVVKRMGYD